MLNLKELLKEQPEIRKGCFIEFMYFPLIGFDREYSCIVQDVNDKRIIGEVLFVNPHPIFDLSYRFFSRKRMKVNTVIDEDKRRYCVFENAWSLNPLILD